MPWIGVVGTGECCCYDHYDSCDGENASAHRNASQQYVMVVGDMGSQNEHVGEGSLSRSRFLRPQALWQVHEKRIADLVGVG